MAQPVDAPRRAALTLLMGVTEEGALLSELLPKVMAPLAPADRARAQRLATGTLRWADRADRALGPFLRMKPWPRTHNAMRLALYEIYVEGAAEHGAVNAAVESVRSLPDTAHQAGLTNAVLRNVIRKGGWDALPMPQLPKWLRKPLIADFGKARIAEMERAFAKGAPLDLTARGGDGAALAERLGGTLLPTGSVRLTNPGQVSALPGYDTGDWWVQDAAAALPAQILNAQPGERVLDMCAAPGGKTMQLAATGATVTAIDSSETRMARLRANLTRTQLTADTIVADALAFTSETPFDAILLDAPCSATGTLRRHPDLPYAKDGSNFPDLFLLQEQMIDAALALLKPGGRLIYCTCSLLIDEGEEQVRDTLERHPTLTIEPISHPAIPPEWHTPEGIRITPEYWPDLGHLDGFFITILRRPT
ncbi:RsmB/NOP family class I SAM-dependent RNA methyltransferase [Oceaniglobus ichthyenteri]|uniref:RsmB/NOP family class I SAM-dependent RNA methyltransferase n=1 Tax=Oceaniglobus ichthyenteri TaxID=2136177 RepID=UPI000D3DA8BC|nr:RsmB/NOP family class I SAM-dependent RNA methyltransferase [Oceaniglobus ichthyenteri]